MSDRDERLLDAFLEDLGSAPVPPDLARSVSRRINDQQPSRANRLTAWWGLAAAAVAILALGGLVFAVAGPKPSPSVSAVPPSASSSASPSASAASPAPTPVPSNPILPTPSPTLGPSDGPQASPAAFHVTLDLSGNPLPVLVSDLSMTVQTAGAIEHNLAGTSPVEVIQGSSPDAVIVGWLGSGCELFTEVALDGARTTVTVSDMTTNQACDPNTSERAVQITFTQPVAASSLSARFGVPLGIHPALSPTSLAFTDQKHGYVAGIDLQTGLAYYMATNDVDAETFFSDMPIGWGTVTGLGVTVDARGSAFLVVALSCPSDNPPDPGCNPGIYLGPGPRWSRMSGANPTALAAQGSHLVALVVGTFPANGTAAFPPRKVTHSADAGQTWQTVDSPCPDLSATGIALDGQNRTLVVCEGGGATGTSRKTMYRSTDATATAWTKLPAPPETGIGFQMSLAADSTGLMWGPRSPLLLTTDGGKTWMPNSIADGNVRTVDSGSALPGGNALILVWDPDVQWVLLLRTTDGGKTWKQLVRFPPPRF